MTIEMTLLLWSTALAFAHILVQMLLSRRNYGMAYLRSQRDSTPEPNKWTVRGNSALRNFLESYGIFIALTVTAELTGRSDGLTQWGAQLWFWARWLFLPAYFIDALPMRSPIWGISLLGLVLMFIGVAF